jgi:DNA-binding transcriptional LysR family regulator
MDDRLQQLTLFVRTVESGSFSKAAREFGLSQPSVSRSIAALERRLGVKLLIRTTRQVSATDAGEALLARARDALLAIDEAESAARGADHLSGVLRVALPPEYGVRRVVPLLPAFFARHPLLKIDLMMSDRFENLIAEGADLALRLGDLPDSSFVARKLESSRRLFIAAPSYLARRGAPTSLADLARHDIISGPPDTSDEAWAARYNGRIERQTLSPRIRSRSATGVVACAVAGLGIATGSTWMCADALASGAIVEILADYGLDPIQAYVVFPAGRKPSQRARAFSDYLEQTLAAIGEEKALATNRRSAQSQPLRKA